MIYFLNIMLTWKIVRVSKVSILYIYIDEKINFLMDTIFHVKRKTPYIFVESKLYFLENNLSSYTLFFWVRKYY